MMRRLLALLLSLLPLLLVPAGAQAQADLITSTGPDGRTIGGTVMWCRTGDGRAALPCGSATPLSVLTMPFQRTGDPILLPASPTPQQFQVAQPVGTRSYRGVNPCSVDIRIKTVATMSETVTASTGTRFLARTSETLASSPSLTGQIRIVSIMTVGDPGAGGCVFELGYGNGG